MRFAPELRLGVSRETLILLLGWFAVCLLGLIGGVANVAHASGLVAGMVIGAVPRVWSGRGHELMALGCYLQPSRRVKPVAVRPHPPTPSPKGEGEPDSIGEASRLSTRLLLPLPFRGGGWGVGSDAR